MRLLQEISFRRVVEEEKNTRRILVLLTNGASLAPWIGNSKAVKRISVQICKYPLCFRVGVTELGERTEDLYAPWLSAEDRTLG